MIDRSSLAATAVFVVSLAGGETKAQEPTMPAGVDHLVYAAPDLAAGMDAVERLLGVRPVRGGRHPDFGTHNALVSLGPATYLEVIAPDPELPRPGRGRLFGVDELDAPRLVTWVLRSEAIDALAAKAASRGVGLGAVASGSRERPDGTRLSWRLTDPWVMPLGGAVPFLIAWGDTPHPASAAPAAGELVGLSVESPDVERLRDAFEALGVAMAVTAGERVQLVATVRTPAGLVQLR